MICTEQTLYPIGKAKRIAKTSIEWSKLQNLLPKDQQHVYTSLLSKNTQYSLKLASLPANLPKIDFEAYKKQLPNPTAIAALEKGYLSFQAPEPKDNDNLLSKIDQMEKDENAKLVEFLKSVSKEIESLNAEKFKLNNIPPLEEMTAELEVYYFPERAPKYADFLEEEDLYTKKLTEGKKGHH